MEYSHMDELGFSEDKQFMCTATGFLSSPRAMKRMCDRFIRNGGRMYDILTAYDEIMSYGLERESRDPGDSIRTIVPLLRAAGATDSSLYEHFKNDMGLMPGADVIHYLNGVMTSAVVSEAYIHHATALCDSLGLPVDSIDCSDVSFDDLQIEKQEAKQLRAAAAGLAKMDVPRITVRGEMQYIDYKDQMILDTTEEIIKNIESTDAFEDVIRMRLMGDNDKALALMDMKRRTEVDLQYTAYIGNNSTDCPSMNIVRDNGGLSISFNGDSYAVREADVAVMSPNSIVAAVLVTEFYAEGSEGVFSLIDSWDRKKLREREFSDKHLMGALLRTFPSKLPDVVIVDDDNLDDVIRESERFRRKLTV